MEKITLDLTRKELQLLAGILMLYKLNGFESINPAFKEVGIELAEKVSLLDVQQYAKV